MLITGGVDFISRVLIIMMAENCSFVFIVNWVLDLIKTTSPAYEITVGVLKCYVLALSFIPLYIYLVKNKNKISSMRNPEE